jgi:hypothetical protein
LTASAASVADHSAIRSMSTINVSVDSTRLTAIRPCLVCERRRTGGSPAGIRSMLAAVRGVAGVVRVGV